MNIKILITILIILLSCNIITGEIQTDTWIEYGSDTGDYIGYSTNTLTTGYFRNLEIGDVANFQGLKKVGISQSNNQFTMTDDFLWVDAEYKIDGINIGCGSVGFNKGDVNTFILYFFDEPLDLSDFSGRKVITIDGIWSTQTSIKSKKLHYGFNGATPSDKIEAVMQYSNYWSQMTPASGGYNYDYLKEYYFENIIKVTEISLNQYNINISRDSSNQANYTIIGNETTYLYEDSLSSEILDITITEKPVNISGINSYSNNYNHIFFSIDDDEPPTLTTDKTYYNTSETITISYTNIQSIYDDCTGYSYDSKCEHPYELYILYPIYSDNPYNQWGAKYQMYIPYYYATDGTGIKYDDGSITLNTSILSPQNTYVLALLGKNGYYGKTDDIQLFSDSFTVYPANEYLNTNCEGRSTYNGCEAIIYYKIDNNSNIIIKDNDNNIINQYYNIINEGELIYTIPGDLEHLNTYPNWKIYLNNTDYATSYNQNLTVYWSLFIEPTETPTISPTETPDINISVQLDDLNTEIKPLKDLMFGLVYIVVDNPDYNTDNVISEHEINNWLNSIIPLCLFLCLIILYIGLRKKRE